jgi:hypothetical protein
MMKKMPTDMYPPQKRRRMMGRVRGKGSPKAFLGRAKASIPWAVNTRKHAIPRIP